DGSGRLADKRITVQTVVDASKVFFKFAQAFVESRQLSPGVDQTGQRNTKLHVADQGGGRFGDFFFDHFRDGLDTGQKIDGSPVGGEPFAIGSRGIADNDRNFGPRCNVHFATNAAQTAHNLFQP